MGNGIEFFGKVDKFRDRDSGEIIISSSYPAWYHEAHIAMLEEDRDRAIRSITQGVADPDFVERAKERIRRLEERIEAIQTSKPQLRPKDKDRVARAYEVLGKAIRNDMPSRSEMNKGLVDMKKHVSCNKDKVHDIGEFGDLYESANIQHSDGKVSGDERVKLWKICGRLLDENTNSESLRKDYKHGTFKGDIPLEELLRERL